MARDCGLSSSGAALEIRLRDSPATGAGSRRGRRPLRVVRPRPAMRPRGGQPARASSAQCRPRTWPRRGRGGAGSHSARHGRRHHAPATRRRRSPGAACTGPPPRARRTPAARRARAVRASLTAAPRRPAATCGTTPRARGGQWLGAARRSLPGGRYTGSVCNATTPRLSCRHWPPSARPGHVGPMCDETRPS